MGRLASAGHRRLKEPSDVAVWAVIDMAERVRFELQFLVLITLWAKPNRVISVNREFERIRSMTWRRE
jgi:hypothetical protein